MRYTEQQTTETNHGIIYSQSEGLHFMLNFTVSLALVIGIILWILGRHGKILWLQVWSAGLILCSIVYLVAATLGWIT